MVSNKILSPGTRRHTCSRLKDGVISNSRSFAFLFSWILLLPGTGSFVLAQNRVDQPMQVQLNLSGVFLRTAGPSMADKEVENLEVDKWLLPGIDIGYHFNEKIYLGYSFQPNRRLTLTEDWSFDFFNPEKDGKIEVLHNTGNAHCLESRIFPFPFDLYATLFFTHITTAPYEMTFTRKNQFMKMGEGMYETDIRATWDFKSLTTYGVGVGYNYVSSNGLSAILGIQFPLAFSNILHRNIVIFSDQTISDKDYDKGVESIQNEGFYFPVLFHFNLGYNFSI